MGVGKITEPKETAGGTVQAGGRTVLPKDAAAGFDPLKANVDPFKERERQIESLRPIADAIGRQALATTGIEKASATRADIDEIRNGNPNGDGNGGHVGMWRDKGGVWRKALNSDQMSADERAMVTRLAREELRHRRDERLRGETNDVRAFVNRETGEDIAAFEGDCDEALLVGRIGENFGRAQAAVVRDAGAATSEALGRTDMDKALNGTLKAVGGDAFDADAAARQRTDLWARQYVRKSLEGRMKAAVVLASQSGGLMKPDAALKRANEIYDGQARELMRRLVEAGEYDRARTFVGRAEELGYSGAVKAKALEEIDAAEIGAATAEGLKAYSTVWDGEGGRILGRDKILDAQIATLKRVAKDAPKGSRTAIAALQQAKRFEEAADEIAFGDLLDVISEGQYFVEDDPKKGGVPKLPEQPPMKGTRAARLWPKAVEAYRKQGGRRNGDAAKAAVGIDIFNAVSQNNPQGFVAKQNERFENGEISETERNAAIVKLRSVLVKGVSMNESTPGLYELRGEKPPMQDCAEKMLKIVSDSFGVDLAAGLKKDKDGKLEYDEKGRVRLAEDADVGDVKFRTTKVSGRSIVSPGSFTPFAYLFGRDRARDYLSTSTHRIDAAKMVDIINSGLELFMANGTKVKVDDIPPKFKFLVSKKEESEGFHEFNVLRDFQAFVDRMKASKEAEHLFERGEEEKARRTAEGQFADGDDVFSAAADWNGIIRRTAGIDSSADYR